MEEREWTEADKQVSFKCWNCEYKQSLEVPFKAGRYLLSCVNPKCDKSNTVIVDDKGYAHI